MDDIVAASVVATIVSVVASVVLKLTVVAELGGNVNPSLAIQDSP